MTINIDAARQELTNIFKANILTSKRGTGVPLVPLFIGMPGIGKSAMNRAVADQYNLKLIDIRLPNEDPVTLNGAIGIESGRTVFHSPTRIPLSTDPLPLHENKAHLQEEYAELLANGTNADLELFQADHCYSGWYVFMDELPNTPRAVQSVAYKILLEREVGQEKIHQRCMMGAAGNRIKDKAGASTEMDNALKSRLVHIEVGSDAQLHIDNMRRWKWDIRIQSFLQSKPQLVNTFQAYVEERSSDLTYCCERTWDALNSYLLAMEPNQNQPIPVTRLEVLKGIIGSHATELIAFTSVIGDLPAIADIARNPTGAHVPDNQGARFFLANSLATHLTEDNADALVAYIKRLGNEFAYAFVSMAYQSNSDVMMYPAMTGMAVEFGKMLTKFSGR